MEHLDTIKKYLIGQNVKIKEEIQIPGQQRFSFIDPFDNRIELLEKENPERKIYYRNELNFN
ncbi:hypothetical protein [Chryseobacterium camelliae]|uniref:hypothetical protein n=1 Tax=Chryseobacterium camelliae TaxID=1265445 RepID=UPI002854C3C8|nr:hypothetical protein [Chryseobacterium camelliae]MDR6513849.1 hypothetical protein [Chryseobacterium camelliae]